MTEMRSIQPFACLVGVSNHERSRWYAKQRSADQAVIARAASANSGAPRRHEPLAADPVTSRISRSLLLSPGCSMASSRTPGIGSPTRMPRPRWAGWWMGVWWWVWSVMWGGIYGPLSLITVWRATSRPGCIPTNMARRSRIRSSSIRRAGSLAASLPRRSWWAIIPPRTVVRLGWGCVAWFFLRGRRPAHIGGWRRFCVLLALPRCWRRAGQRRFFVEGELEPWP